MKKGIFIILIIIIIILSIWCFITKKSRRNTELNTEIEETNNISNLENGNNRFDKKFR